jgi:hypothetical protein
MRINTLPLVPLGPHTKTTGTRLFHAEHFADGGKSKHGSRRPPTTSYPMADPLEAPKPPTHDLTDTEAISILRVLYPHLGMVSGQPPPPELTTHDILEVAAYGHNSDHLDRYQYQLLLEQPIAILAWFVAHRGPASINATATPPLSLDLGRGLQYSGPFTLDLSASNARPWTPLMHAILRRHETTRQLQQERVSLQIVNATFDEITRWLLDHGAILGEIPIQSIPLRYDLLARGLTHIPSAPLIDRLLDELIAAIHPKESVTRKATAPTGCPFLLLALEHGHLSIAQRIFLELGANTAGGSIHVIYTDMTDPSYTHFASWITDIQTSRTVFNLTVRQGLGQATTPAPPQLDEPGANPFSRLAGIPAITETIADYTGTYNTVQAVRLKRLQAELHATLNARYLRTLLLDRDANRLGIDRHYARVILGSISTNEKVLDWNLYEEWQNTRQLDILVGTAPGVWPGVL